MTTETRYHQAVLELRRSGIRVRQNVQACCRGCVTIPGDISALLWTFGGQGSAVSFSEGEPYYRSDLQKKRKSYRFIPKKVENLYWYFEDEKIAALAANIFRQNGFTVEWNGNKNHALVVNF